MFLVPLFLIKKLEIIFIIEFPLMFWGMAELFQNDKCVELRASHVWNIGIATCILEMLVCVGVIIYHRTVNSSEPEPEPEPSHRHETYI
jgi:hypothetical protein